MHIKRFQPQRVCYRSSQQNHRFGAFTVEFALCSSILFLTIFAGLEFTRFMFARHAVDQAAFEAARVGIVRGRTAADVTAMASSMLSAAGMRNATITITPTTFNDATTEVTVQVSCPFASNSWLPPRIFGSQPIVSTVTLDHENNAFLIPNGGPQVGNNNNEPRDYL